MSILTVQGLTHEYGDIRLYRNLSLEVNREDHMGLVGPNGAGKSTLLKIMRGDVIPDEGRVSTMSKCRVGYLDQYAQVDPQIPVGAYLKTAFQGLYQMEEQLGKLYRQMETDSSEKVMERAAQIAELLENRDFYGIPAHIERVAAGLGVTAFGMQTQIQNLSGGQRAKVMLAKLLLEKPDLLLLDEPTNFLDVAHVDWLAKFLQGYSGAFVLVSHQGDFLDRVCNCIGDLEFETLTKYRGNYTAFCRQKGQKREELTRQYENQQKLIRRTEAYIAKNRVRAATAAMAKSREKALQKIVRLAPPAYWDKPVFQFPSLPASVQRVMEAEMVSIGYARPLLPPLSFSLQNGEILVIKGFNGIGKTTLLNTIAGRLPKLGGEIRIWEPCIIGYYEQDFTWDDGATPLSYLAIKCPDERPATLRKALSRCGLKTEHMLQSLPALSGGEQAKVKFAELTLKPHHVLLLDEPTNHLDQPTKEALRNAIQEFPGSRILVSHEQAFYEPLHPRILDIEHLV